MIIKNVSQNETTDITFSCPMSQISEAEAAINKASKKKEISFKACVIDTEVAKVSIVGIGMRSHAGIAKKMFETETVLFRGCVLDIKLCTPTMRIHVRACNYCGFRS